MTVNQRLWRVVKNLGREAREVRLSQDDYEATLRSYGPATAGQRLVFRTPWGEVELLPPAPEALRWPHDADGRPVEGA